MRDLILQFRDFFVSLKLTVVLLSMGIVLIFAATLDQVNLDVWAVQEKYFNTFFVLWKVGDVPIPVFAGGYLVGGFLFVNLLAAHIYRFKMSWRKTGIFLTHIGLLLLLLGQLSTSLLQRETQLTLAEGETKAYSESILKNELAVINVTDPAFDDVVAIPDSVLAREGTVQHPKLPFSVVTKLYYPNADFRTRTDDPGAPPPVATQGPGRQVIALPLPLDYRPPVNNIPSNIPVAYVELVGTEGSLGTWMFRADGQTKEGQVVSFTAHFEYAGKTWKVAFRPQRTYYPFSVSLIKITNDIYPGTDIPKNFSSRVHVASPDGVVDFDSLIYMNHPLRYGGLTFYQNQMDSVNHVTGIQVVRNPSWLLPYVSCALMAIGLITQFGIHLTGFIRKRRTAAAALTPAPQTPRP